MADAITLFNNVVTDDINLASKFSKNKYVKVTSLLIRTFASLETIKAFLRDTYATHFAYIYHDKDTKEDGTLNEPHYHLLVHWDFQIALRCLNKHFVAEETIVQQADNTASCYSSLTHKNCKGKVIYTEGDIITNDYAFYASTVKEPSINSFQCSRQFPSRSLLTIAANKKPSLNRLKAKGLRSGVHPSLSISQSNGGESLGPRRS